MTEQDCLAGTIHAASLLMQMGHKNEAIAVLDRCTATMTPAAKAIADQIVSEVMANRRRETHGEHHGSP